MGLFSLLGKDVATIGSSFTYQLADGSHGQGIPPVLPQLLLPWELPAGDGQPMVLSWQTLSALLPAAFSMAVLGAIESLLCAVVLDGMTRTKHNANGELVGQGLGNIIAPFFGGARSFSFDSVNVAEGINSLIFCAF